MSHQSTDHAVASAVLAKVETTAKLRRVLGRAGIRDPHTSPKAREAIRLALVTPFTEKQQREGGR